MFVLRLQTRLAQVFFFHILSIENIYRYVVCYANTHTQKQNLPKLRDINY